MNGVAKYLPLNQVEHENMLRSIIASHQGPCDGNPSMWVVHAVAEAFQRGFGTGFNAGLAAANSPPPPPPAFKVAFEQAPTPRAPRQIGRDDNVVDV